MGVGETTSRGGNAVRRVERAHRILDTAGELVLRLGYDRTTLEDIARRADVPKGTIYLHWKTRESLFVALLRRDRVAMLEDLAQRLSAGTDSVGEVFEQFAHALLARPLSRAVLLGETRVLGKLVRGRSAEQVAESTPFGLAGYLERLRTAKLVRTDLDLVAQVNVATSMFLGALHAAELLPDEFRLADQQRGALLGEALQRFLDSGAALDGRRRAALRDATDGYLRGITETGRAKYRESMGFDEQEAAE